MLAAGEFDFKQLSGLSGSDGAITLSNATGQRLSLSNMYFFVGVGGAFTEDADGNVTGLDTDEAIGFSVSGASLDLVIVKRDGRRACASWMGVAAHVNGMGVHGLPDVFELEILNLDLRFNGKAADASKLELGDAGRRCRATRSRSTARRSRRSSAPRTSRSRASSTSTSPAS